MNTDIKLKVAEIQRFCMHDGPGVRTTVFLKGCPLRCAWCHNPETQDPEPEILFYKSKCIGCGTCGEICPSGAHGPEEFERGKCIKCGACAESCPSAALELCGTDMTVGQIADSAERDRAFYKDKGGVTLSGGEPLAQSGSVALLKECRERGLNTVVDTCGYVRGDTLLRAVPYTDLFLWDIKDTDEARHKEYTGAPLSPILENLKLVSEAGAGIRLRCILINGINTDEEHYLRLAKIASGIDKLDGIDVIPYHAYAGTKATFIGRCDNGRTEWIPPDDEVARANEIIRGLI